MKLTRLLALALLPAACARAPAPAPPPAETPPPPPAAVAPPAPSARVVPAGYAPEVAREFRGVWVASVSNIDWPSRKGLTTEQQKAELIALLDRAAELRLNAVILQVRPAGDALYPSALEPWSEYLTGAMGRAPDPYYDPLAFALEEAHRRGLELHAWFNPFRAKHSSARSAPTANHFIRAHPDKILRYGDQLWMDPAEPVVQEHALQVVLDVLRRYEVDGIHIDDYFYPYRVEDSRGRTVPFPDDASWRRYRAGGGSLERGDWRRDNVNRFVERLYGAVKAEKPWVKVGISPFGIWRPGYPRQVVGLDSYHEIFADSRKWLQNGWLDYIVPQLYWTIDQRQQSFPVLLDWWSEQNRHARHLWPGSHANRVTGRSSGWPAREIAEQIRVTRQRPSATGNVLFSARTLMRSPDGLNDRLIGEYAEPALVPASPWLGGDAPAPPRLSARQTVDGTRVSIAPGDTVAVRQWTVRARVGARWTAVVIPGTLRSHLLPIGAEEVVVTAVGRVGLESPAVLLAP